MSTLLSLLFQLDMFYFFFFFFGLTAVARTMLTRTGESGYPCLVPELVRTLFIAEYYVGYGQ